MDLQSRADIDKISPSHTLIDDRLYSAVLRSLEQTHCARMWFYMSDWLFIARLFLFLYNITRSGVLTALAWLVPNETAAVSAQVLCIPYNHAPCHFMQSHRHRREAGLAFRPVHALPRKHARDRGPRYNTATTDSHSSGVTRRATMDTPV